MDIDLRERDGDPHLRKGLPHLLKQIEPQRIIIIVVLIAHPNPDEQLDCAVFIRVDPNVGRGRGERERMLRDLGLNERFGKLRIAAVADRKRKI